MLFLSRKLILVLSLTIVFTTLEFAVSTSLFEQGAQSQENRDEAPYLAVLELDYKGDFAPDVAATLTDRIRAHLLHSQQYRLLEREKMEQIIKEQGFQQSALACADQSCSVQLGHLLGVQYLLSGSVSKIDNLYVLNARLMDVEKGQIVREEFVDCECQLKDLLTQGTRVLSQRLLNQNTSVNAAKEPIVRESLYSQTFAGNGWPGLNEASYAQANFNFPSAIVPVGDKKWVVADTNNNRLRLLDNGSVSVLSGSHWNWLTGEILSGFADGPALHARFHHPQGLAYHPRGLVFVADTDNHCVRAVNLSGDVKTWVGSTQSGFRDGKLKEARFKHPHGLVLDAQGNLFVADTGNHAIRKISPNGMVTTIIGDGQAGLSDGVAAHARLHSPTALAFDAKGLLYIADTGNHRIVRLNAEGLLQTLAGSQEGFTDGDALQARFKEPQGLAFGTDGILYIADTGNHRIRALKDQQVQTLVGEGNPGYSEGNQLAARFNQPTGLVFHENALYVVDKVNQRIRIIYFTQ